jgi:allophanate hydrolase
VTSALARRRGGRLCLPGRSSIVPRMSTSPSLSLDVAQLSTAYAGGSLRPTDLVDHLTGAGADQPGIWIHRLTASELLAAARALEQRRAAGETLPLYGIPFAVKDNIDVAGLPTTAACPAFSYQAAASAPVVARLLAAGALLVGKTNLDQFATGLVGVRSPYGVPANPFDARYIVGGSSSGSAAAVARGLVSFALGTDTAGSGRVPAAFTNLVGLKPSPGLLSTRGVVPACRSLDCVSVFALTVPDARAVAAVAAAYDAEDPYSRQPAAGPLRWQAAAPRAFRAGVPRTEDRAFFGDGAAEGAFQAALARLAGLGAELVEVDMTPFRETAALLYDGPWIAERLAGLQAFVDGNPQALLPITLQILSDGRDYRGPAVFAGLHRLQALRRRVAGVLAGLDTLVVPTTPTIYRIAEVEAEPRALNANLGRYVNFVNLLDMAGVAVPSGFRPDGLPAGITFLGPWGSDARLAALGEAYHRAVGGRLGATAAALSPAPAPAAPVAPDHLRVAVVGAHLAGQPLNHQLTDRGGLLVASTRTAARYRLYALPGTSPPKPGLVRVEAGRADGAAIELEVWELPRTAFGDFFAGVSAPLCLGSVELEDGARVAGFLCEAHAVAGAEDISRFGGWRGYLARRSAPGL